MRSIAGIVVDGGRVFVARRLPGGSMGCKWEFPGGKLEEGESDDEALVREFDEEFGIVAKPLRPLGESAFYNKGKAYGLAAILVELARVPVELKEHDEVRWVGPADLVALDLADSDRSLLPFVLPLLGAP